LRTTVRPVPCIAAERDQNDQPERERLARCTFFPEGAFLQGARGRALGAHFLTSARCAIPRCRLPKVSQ